MPAKRKPKSSATAVAAEAAAATAAAADTADVQDTKEAGGSAASMEDDDKAPTAAGDRDKALDKSYLRGVTNKDQLLRRLKKLSAVLVELQQSERKEQMKDIAAELSRGDLLKSKSQDVRLLVACCIADVLRITAPDAPFDKAQLHAIFELFIGQLRGVTQAANSPNQTRHFHLLESLAMIKTCLIIVDFDTDELLIKLFQTFFEMAKEEPNNLVEFHMLDIMCSCIDETQAISVQLLDLLLRNLIPPQTGANPHAYRMTQSIINRCMQQLEGPIQKFVRKAVTHTKLDDESEADDDDDGDRKGKGKAKRGRAARKAVEETDFDEPTSSITDRKAQLHVIYELALSCPNILTSILPAFQEALEVPDETTRIGYANLFGRVFTQEKSVLADQSPHFYASWLKRFHDASPDIRYKLCEFSKDLLVTRNHSTELVEQLYQRLSDKDDKIRHRAVQSIVEAALVRPQNVDNKLITAVRSRTLDKKPNVRREAMEGLAHLFKQHCAESWKKGASLSEAGKRFSWAPRRIVSMAQGQQMSLVVETLFDEDILDASYSLKERTCTMIGISASFDEKAAQAFQHIMHEKAVVQSMIREVFAIKQQIKNAADPATLQKLEVDRKDRLTLLARRFPASDKTQKEKEETIAQLQLANYNHFLALIDHKDKNVHKYIEKLVDPTAEYQTLRTTKVDLIKAIGSQKGSLTDFTKRLWTRCANILLPADCVKLLFDQAHDNLGFKPPRVILAASALGLLRVVAANFPQVLSHSIDALLGVLQHPSATPPLKLITLEILSQLDPAMSKNSARSLAMALVAMLPTCTPAFMQFLIPTALRCEKVAGDGVASELDAILLHLSEHLELKDERILVSLEGYKSLAKHSLPKFEASVETLLPYVQDEVLPASPFQFPPHVIDAKKLGIAVMVQYLTSKAQVEESDSKSKSNRKSARKNRGEESNPLSPASIVKLLFLILEKNADPLGTFAAQKDDPSLVEAPKKKGAKKANGAAEVATEDSK